MKKLLILYLLFFAIEAKCFSFEQENWQNAPLSLDYTAVKLFVAPSSDNFKYVKIGDSLSKKFQLINLGNSSVKIKEIKLKSEKENLPKTGFKIRTDWDLNIPLDSGETREILVTYLAADEGYFSDSIGVADSCFFKYYALVKAYSGLNPVTVSEIDFGNCLVGRTTENKPIEVKNNGKIPLHIFDFKLPVLSGFTAKISEGFNKIINPGETSLLYVNFTPPESGVYLDSLVFICNSDNSSDITSILRGSAYDNTLSISMNEFDYCEEDDILINFKKVKAFGVGNIFTFQLSDKNGSFSNPKNFYEFKTTKNDTLINCRLPRVIVDGTKFRMRVISSIPPEISSDNQEDLTILLKPPKPTITQEGNKLTANYSIGYQWYLNGDALYLANSRTHTAKKDGYYKVKVIEQGCFSDFSDSIYINVTSVSNEIYDSFSIFPNPASNYITLQANGCLPQKEIQIFNIFGERVLFTPSSLRDDTPQEGNFKINVSSLPPGIYFIRIGVEKPLKFLKI